MEVYVHAGLARGHWAGQRVDHPIVLYHSRARKMDYREKTLNL